MDALGLPIAGLTAPALLLVAVWLILTGRIVPRRTYEEKAKEADYWRAAALESMKQSGELLDAAKTTQAVIQALPKARSDK